MANKIKYSLKSENMNEQCVFREKNMKMKLETFLFVDLFLGSKVIDFKTAHSFHFYIFIIYEEYIEMKRRYIFKIDNF
jgi:hypothetical protein